MFPRPPRPPWQRTNFWPVFDEIDHRLQERGILRNGREIGLRATFRHRGGDQGIRDAADDRSWRDADDAVEAGAAGHLFLPAVLAVLGELVRRVLVFDQVVDVGIDLNHHAAAATAIAAIGPPVRHVLFPKKAERPGAAIARAGHDADAINEHGKNLRRVAHETQTGVKRSPKT